MAQLIPMIDPEQVEHDSERRALRALARLPNAYVVMNSYPWLRPQRDRPDAVLREGEADFVVLHPTRGLLVVEVKGGACELEGRVWTRAGAAIRDPFDQARRSRYALLAAVEERTRGAVHRDMFTHGDLVMFPHHTLSGALPLNADPRTAVDESGLADLEQRVLDAFEAWGGLRGPPPAVFERLKAALLPSLRLVRCSSADIATEAERMVQLTHDQHAVLRGLVGSRRVLIEGVAGSGKTLLALEYAFTLAEQGSRVLLLCYNRHLAAWMAERIAAEPRLAGAPGSVEAANFHRYALRLAKAAGVEFEVPSDARQFWEEEAALLLEQAIEYLRGGPEEPRFDAVIVDEGQDFAPDWWVTVEELCGGSSGALYVFLDVVQSLRPSGGLPKVSMPAQLTLDVNCRNTRRITRSGAALGKVQVRVLEGAPEGVEPVLRRPASSRAAQDAVIAEVRGLLKVGVRPSQIAILGPAALEQGSLRGVERIDGVPLTSDAMTWRRSSALLVSTARAFKGLEADVVVLYDLNTFGDLFTRADLYVAWTRARHRLVVVCQPGEVSAEIELALAEAR
jgi:hypothetical protein